MLRKIYGGKMIRGLWYRRTNEEIGMLFKEPNLIGVIKAQRIGWMGHIGRMPQERMAKQILDFKLSGRRRRGRPKPRWKKEVEEDVKCISNGNWREKCKSRKVWKDVINQAKGHFGL